MRSTRGREARAARRTCAPSSARHAATRAGGAARACRRSRVAGGNVFEELMETVKVASLGQISEALFDVGGRYRRAM